MGKREEGYSDIDDSVMNRSAVKMIQKCVFPELFKKHEMSLRALHSIRFLSSAIHVLTTRLLNSPTFCTLKIGFSGFLPQSNDVRVRLVGRAKIAP